MHSNIHTPRPSLPVPFYDLDRTAWTVLDRWTPAPVTLPPTHIVFN